MVIHSVMVTGRSYPKTFLQIHESKFLDDKKFMTVVREMFMVRNSYQGILKVTY